MDELINLFASEFSMTLFNGQFVLPVQLENAVFLTNVFSSKIFIFFCRVRHGRQKHFFDHSIFKFWDICLRYHVFFQACGEKSQKYTFRSLFYYTLSVCICRFLINASKVGVTHTVRKLSLPCTYSRI